MQINSISDLPKVLRQSFVKLQRARHHIEELEFVFTKYLEDTPPTVSTNIINNPDGTFNGYQFNFNSTAVPEHAAAIFGDAIHNMRSALDLAACECVRANNKSDNGVYFPFCEKGIDLEKIMKKRNITKAKFEVVDYIRSLKPYKGGNDALRGIHDLDIRDKHQGLMPQPTSIASPVLESDSKVRLVIGKRCNSAG